MRAPIAIAILCLAVCGAPSVAMPLTMYASFSCWISGFDCSVDPSVLVTPQWLVSFRISSRQLEPLDLGPSFSACTINLQTMLQSRPFETMRGSDNHPLLSTRSWLLDERFDDFDEQIQRLAARELFETVPHDLDDLD
jgi:hypothetical protein